MTEQLILVNVIKEAIDSMSIQAYYEPGRSIQILQSINDKDNGISSKNEKYPLIAVLMPIRESRGSGFFYGKAKIPRIVIATITGGDSPVLPRFNSSGTFQTVLYPLYYEFLFRLANHPNVVGTDPEMLVHDCLPNPGQQPIGEGLSDYIDSIEILNLELNLIQSKTC